MAKRTTAITADIAKKVLAVVDKGLVRGVGVAKPGQMCVEAAVCYALDLPHGDNPQCVSRALRSLKIRLNDSDWSSKEARAKGLRRLAVAQLGSAGHLDDREFVKRCAELAIRTCVPRALRAAASVQKNVDHKAALLAAATKCEAEGTRAAALQARSAAAYAAYAAAAAAAADAAAAAADAAANAAAADAGANAAAADAGATFAFANAADAYAAAADAAANAAANAANAADAAANAADAKKVARDEEFSAFAEGVVQILVDMGAPGVQWLSLTEAA